MAPLQPFLASQWTVNNYNNYDMALVSPFSCAFNKPTRVIISRRDVCMRV